MRRSNARRADSGSFTNKNPGRRAGVVVALEFRAAYAGIFASSSLGSRST